MPDKEVDINKEYFILECKCKKLYKIKTKTLQEKSSGQFVCRNCKRTITYTKNIHFEPLYMFDFEELESAIDEISF